MSRKPARAHEPAQNRSDLPRRSEPKRSRAEIEFDEPAVLGALFGQFDRRCIARRRQLTQLHQESAERFAQTLSEATEHH